ncbi:MAG TPA: permease [Gammaproteobacteria bacterium]|nr:permease [Gammaproteobacteria bacterium]
MNTLYKNCLQQWLICNRWAAIGAAAALLFLALWPSRFAETAGFVLRGMIEVAPLVVPGILVSAWINASGAAGRVRQVFDGRRSMAIFAASAIGAVTPVCGVTVLPLMTGLLASGVPLAPVMAFWLASPVTDPAMFAVTAATLGWPFAIGKALAALLLGLAGGFVTAAIAARPWIGAPLRNTGLAAMLGKAAGCESDEVVYAFWHDSRRRHRFGREFGAMSRLIVVCLGLAFAAEYQMQELLQPQAFAAYLGRQSAWAVPLAVLVGSPVYLDGYAALPLVRGLIDHGMSPGAAMAFLVSGSVVSIWGAIAIFPVLGIRPFLLYLLLAALGSLAVGWGYGIIA